MKLTVTNIDDKAADVTFVDMAGSEPFAYTNNRKQQKEQKAINLSLSFFVGVMMQINENQDHVSYRNSRLTELLKSELGNIHRHLF